MGHAQPNGPSTIAVDGPAASGKSTVGRLAAERLGYLFLDTGLLYRALTLLALEAGVDPRDGPALAALAAGRGMEVAAAPGSTTASVTVDGRDVTARLHTPGVDGAVSAVSAHGAVRDALLAHQRRPAERGRVVMVGRDIGTVVLPSADLKIYLDASAEERARRRFRQRLARGEPAEYAAVLAAVRHRDALDSGRALAPLAAASDAVVVDTDDCELPATVEHVLALVRRWPDELTTAGGRAPCGAPAASEAQGSDAVEAEAARPRTEAEP